MGDMSSQYPASPRRSLRSEKQQPPKDPKTPDASEVTCKKCREDLKLLEKDEEKLAAKGKNCTGNPDPVEKKEKISDAVPKPEVLENNNHYYFLIIPVIIILVGIAIVYGLDFPKEQAKPLAIKTIAKFYNRIQSIRKKLRDEDIASSFLKIVNRTITSYFKEEVHVQPTVILLLATENGPYMCCFMWDIIDSVRTLYFEHEYTVGHIKWEDLSKKSENERKAYIEESIIQIVGTDEKKISLITMKNIDQFPVNTLSKLHTYFDNDNAPHKNVVFLLTATTVFTKGKPVSDIAKNHFDEVWNDYREEHRRALMGRMLSNVALLRPNDIKNDTCTECKSTF